MYNPWIIIVALVAFITCLVSAFLRYKSYRKKHHIDNKKSKSLANTEYIRALPEYKKAKRLYNIVLASLGGLFLLATLAVTIVAARPVSVSVAKPQYEKRDIVLCLDVSGSMYQYLDILLEYFSRLVDEFKGQRVGVTIFDGVYFTLSPLSDDYYSLKELFKDVRENFGNYTSALVSAQYNSSEIGQGLVGCVNSFDKIGENRSRAIIFATDNLSYDAHINLTQAANYAKRFDIPVYGLSTFDSRTQEEVDNMSDGDYEYSVNKEFREAMLLTGGAYYPFSDSNVSTSQIIRQILDQAAARYEGAETIVKKDNPLIPTIIAIVCIVSCMIMIWRLGV